MTELPREAAQYFPYDSVRPYQGEFINAIYNAVKDGKSALIEGSNGLGKTISALTACLPIAVEHNLKILYVARTHRQHDRVIEELQAISDTQPVTGISTRGRHEICLNTAVTRYASDALSAMEACEFLKAKNRCQYFRRIEEKANEYSDLQQHVAESTLKATEIQNLCRRRGFCPYELTKSSLSDMNVIALSYLYIFDPEIRTVFLKSLEEPLANIILIIDEAHNLPETAADIASSSLTLFTLRQAEEEAKKFRYKQIAQFTRKLKKAIEDEATETKKETLIPQEFLTDIVTEENEGENPKTFFESLYSTGNVIKKTLLADGQYPRSFIHGMSKFLLRWTQTAGDDAFIYSLKNYASRRGLPTSRLEIVALDPSRVTEPVFSSTWSNIAMSGTLQPLDAYVRMTGLPEQSIREVVPSPFPKEHILPIICSGVSTAMEKRSPEMYTKIIKRISEVVKYTPVSTGVFAASYEVLSALIANGLKKALKKTLFCEHRRMPSKENEKMITEFKAKSKTGGAVLLGVQGGRSSEGVDFPGDQMNSVAIVGIPYAEPTPRVKAQIGYFEKQFPGYGREYGYVIPAMKRASQAAGRPIRTLEDKGAMIFLDYRFGAAYCQSFLPLWIKNNLKMLPDAEGALSSELTRFFRAVS
jgi:DNA excision repair protein ERCC-2